MSEIFRFTGTWRRIAIFTGIAVVSIFFILFILRSLLFSYFLERKVNRFNNEYHAQLAINKAQLRNISGILLTGISLKPESGDTLLTVDSLRVSVNFWKLFFGHVVFQNLELDHASFRLEDKDSIPNYRFLLMGKHKVLETDTVGQVNYASMVARLSDAVFEKLPESLLLKDLNVVYETSAHKVSFYLDRVTGFNHVFHASVRVNEGDSVKNWILSGSLDSRDHIAGFRLFSSGEKNISIPFIHFRWNAAVSFDTLSFSLSEEAVGDNLTKLHGNASLNGLKIHHEKVAVNDVSFDKLGMEYSLNVGNDFIELDSSTNIIFNRLNFHIYSRYRPKPTKQIAFKIIRPEFPAEELFSSLPGGLFSNLQGIRVKGNLSFTLDFFADLSIPDSLRFMADLKRYGFAVLSYGNADLTRLNTSFQYNVYEKGNPIRSFIVGPENPDFRTLDRISHNLQIAVLNSEDPGFYLHRGFIADAFRESIIQNIKERRFARGGSTITMQLVKNVFLNRNKTISRKIEEILLVWLIENQELCSKERMFEVYLNIIEWGPHIYGANEAAHFYFKKEASKLTLPESIFMASIIPKPKWFMYSFDENGHLRGPEQDFFRLLSGKMLKKEQISQEAFDHLVPDVTLTGPAKLMLKKTDPVPADSLRIQDDPIF